MRLAFSTAIDPTWDLSAVTTKAQALGYDGVEVFLPNAPGTGDPAAGTPLSERDLVRLGFERAGVAVAGVAASLYYSGDAARDAATADAVRRLIDLAARVRAPHVRILDAAVPPGVEPGAAGLRYLDWVVPLADHAARGGVALLVQNALAHRTARRVWAVIDQADHPALGVAWDPLAAASAGESYAVSIPTLNSRIRHVLLRDAAVGRDAVGGAPSAAVSASAAPSNATDRPVGALARLGDGDLHVRAMLDRLRGIGFDGWASVSYPPPSAALGSADELLAHAAAQVKAWLAPPAKAPAAGAKATAVRKSAPAVSAAPA